MNSLLKLSAAIDALSARIGAIARWLVLAAVVISAGNAVLRKSLSFSSNAFLEVQWYLFSAVFLLAAGYTFLRNAHVRIDFVSSHLSARARAWVDIGGIVLVITPLCLLLIWLSWPLLSGAWTSGEVSPDAGGLIRWPVYALVPAGMVLLLLQSYSELLKRVAFLKGLLADPAAEVPDFETLPAEEGADKRDTEGDDKRDSEGVLKGVPKGDPTARRDADAGPR